MTAPVNRPHKKTGRPRKNAPATITTARAVEVLAASGLKVIGIAKALKTSKDRLRRWLDEDPELLEAYERGRASLEFEMFNVLYRTAKSPKEATRDRIVAAMFVLKAAFGWREGDQSDTANRVSINFTLPGALKAEDFLKVVEHEPPDPDKSIPAACLTRT
jgi:hypothetical protein